MLKRLYEAVFPPKPPQLVSEQPDQPKKRDLKATAKQLPIVITCSLCQSLILKAHSTECKHLFCH